MEENLAIDSELPVAESSTEFWIDTLDSDEQQFLDNHRKISVQLEGTCTELVSNREW